VFRGQYLQQPIVVEDAMGIQLAALLVQFDAACPAADGLETAAPDHFEQHPDAMMISSFPGMGALLVAGILAEIADYRT
jgi:hypothetical protein